MTFLKDALPTSWSVCCETMMSTQSSLKASTLNRQQVVVLVVVLVVVAVVIAIVTVVVVVVDHSFFGQLLFQSTNCIF